MNAYHLIFSTSLTWLLGHLSEMVHCASVLVPGQIRTLRCLCVCVWPAKMCSRPTDVVCEMWMQQEYRFVVLWRIQLRYVLIAARRCVFGVLFLFKISFRSICSAVGYCCLSWHISFDVHKHNSSFPFNSFRFTVTACVCGWVLMLRAINCQADITEFVRFHKNKFSAIFVVADVDKNITTTNLLHSFRSCSK